jgi:hypothetical protein
MIFGLGDMVIMIRIKTHNKVLMGRISEQLGHIHTYIGLGSAAKGEK